MMIDDERGEREVSRIRILQDKIHQTIKDICNINNKKAKQKQTNIHKYKANPNNHYNSERNLLSGENHHPELPSLTLGEGPDDPSPALPTSAEWLS